MQVSDLSQSSLSAVCTHNNLWSVGLPDLTQNLAPWYVKAQKNDAALCRLLPENERNNLEEENRKLRTELQKLKIVW